DLDAGEQELCVVVNGIASDPICVTIVPPDVLSASRLRDAEGKVIGEIIWQDPHIHTVRTVDSTTMSASAPGYLLSLLFDTLRLDMQGDGALERAIAVSFAPPVTPPTGASLTGVTLEIRGTVTTSNGSHAALFVGIGDTTHVETFPFGQSQ